MFCLFKLSNYQYFREIPPMKWLVKCSSETYSNIRRCASPISAVRHFSSHDSRPKITVHIEVVTSRSSFVWPETKLGVLEPKDSRFPLPGLVGSNILNKQQAKKKTNYEIDLLTDEQNHERQSSVLEQFLVMNDKSKKSGELAMEEVFDKFDFTAEECPFFLKRDLNEIFYNANLLNRKLSLINIYLRNDTEISSDSSEQFTKVANDICGSLLAIGFWADFIDPKSGRPLLGHGLSDADSYEIEKRCKTLAAKFEVHSGCTIINHKLDKKYVGCLVTTAPVHHPILLALSEMF